MNSNILSRFKSISLGITSLAMLSISTSSAAAGPVRLEVTITNGGTMPVSPGVLYVSKGAESASELGKIADGGFVDLCRAGNAASRAQELRANRNILEVAEVQGPILPGESRTAEISLKNARQSSLHYETMYGRSRDICGKASINSHSLYALVAHVTSAIVARDQVLQTGVYQDPQLRYGSCANANSAVACLREISAENSPAQGIRFFVGYLPSVLSLLENQYGAEETLGISIPQAGALNLNVKLKH